MSARVWLLLLMLAGAGAVRAQGGGDVQVGDRILLQVEGDDSLTDTFTVEAGPALKLRAIGTVSLAGVRRADLESYLARELAKYLRSPVVHAHVLVRMAILGEVEHPGFYAVPADLVLGDALMRAGGPTRDARVERLRVERDRAVIWEGERLRRAIAEGKTLDQMGLKAGDQVVVPRRGDPESKFRMLAILVTLPAAVYGLTRLFH